ncbi:hypothetical protein GCM10020221_27850 [Streptomyces thioluteus]|uniref:Uncharacterized protein n=1 Tax=Streptomyces thioluteus TaxID=66431 RepID=A0ABP6JEE2_STRTU
MVGVVEEEHQVAEADQGVRAVAGPGQVPGVAVHIADHVNSHGQHPRPPPTAFGRALAKGHDRAATCGYFRVTKRRG